MLTSIRGTYRAGRIDLVERPIGIANETNVIVTFLEPGRIDLRSCGIGEKEAAELRARLSAFAEDWESPEMSVYDNYDAAKSRV